MIKELNNIRALLTKKEKTKLILLSVVHVFSGLMDMIGVASIVPFIAVVSNNQSSFKVDCLWFPIFLI